MDWDRIENARNRARSIFVITFVAIALVAFAASGPDSPGPRPMFDGQGAGVLGITLENLPVAAGAFGLLVGLAWMWRIYRAPTKVEGAHWRFHDD